MAGNATIGALRVSLGLDSAQFTSGLKKAETSLGSFGKTAGAGLALVAAAAAAATVALGYAVKGAIDHADALSKSAQKAGVTVEALSRLEYAAKLSDVSLESLTGGLGKLSKGMADAAQSATSTSGVAFKALGIAITENDGKLRSSASVLSDVADRFSRLEDGATKTALAQRIFGKSGADLIPLLNSGAEGLRQMAIESDKVGATISTKTATAAEKFNDTLTRVGQIMQGVVNRVMEGALPSLQALADTLASPQFAEAAAWLAKTLVGAINAVAWAFENAYTWGVKFGTIADKIAENSGRRPTARPGTNEFQQQMAAINSSDAVGKGGSFGELSSLLGTSSGASVTINGGASPSPLSIPTFDALGGGADKAKDKIADLAKGLKAIAPAAAEAQKLAANSLSGLADSALGSLGNLSGALSSLFKQNKAFAVSTAILQGLQGVAYALGSSAPPFNFINAAAVGIEAAANVANILSTNENSTSMPTGGGGGQAAATPAASTGEFSGKSLTIEGISATSLFTGDNMRDLVEQLLDYQKKGGNVIFSKGKAA